MNQLSPTLERNYVPSAFKNYGPQIYSSEREALPTFSLNVAPICVEHKLPEIEGSKFLVQTPGSEINSPVIAQTTP